MPKGKAPADIKHRRQEGKAQKSTHTERTDQNESSGWRIIGRWGAVASIIGLVALLTFWPRPTIVPGDPPDTENPFSAAFNVTNTNVIPLHHLTVKLVPGKLEMEPRNFEPVTHPQFGQKAPTLTHPDWTDQNLSMDERLTITLADLFGLVPGARVAGAEFGMIIDYNAWFVPWQQHKVFAFVTRRQTNGQLYWYSIPNE